MFEMPVSSTKGKGSRRIASHDYIHLVGAEPNCSALALYKQAVYVQTFVNGEWIREFGCLKRELRRNLNVFSFNSEGESKFITFE